MKKNDPTKLTLKELERKLKESQQPWINLATFFFFSAVIIAIWRPDYIYINHKPLKGLIWLPPILFTIIAHSRSKKYKEELANRIKKIKDEIKEKEKSEAFEQFKIDLLNQKEY